MAEHWWLKPEVSWVRFLAAAGLFTFLYFCLITSKFILIHLFPAWGKTLWAFRVRKPLSMGSLSCQCSTTEPWQPDDHQPSQSSMHTAQVVLNASVTHLAGSHSVCAVRTLLGVDWKIHFIRKPEVSWVWLPVAAGLFTFLYFCLTTSKFIYFQCESRCSEYSSMLSLLNLP